MSHLIASWRIFDILDHPCCIIVVFAVVVYWTKNRCFITCWSALGRGRLTKDFMPLAEDSGPRERHLAEEKLSKQPTSGATNYRDRSWNSSPSQTTAWVINSHSCLISALQYGANHHPSPSSLHKFDLFYTCYALVKNHFNLILIFDFFWKNCEFAVCWPLTYSSNMAVCSMPIL